MPGKKEPTPVKRKVRCRHRDSWLLLGGDLEWCYRCGAFRTLAHAEGNIVYPTSGWAKPVGPTGKNPWDKWDEARLTYQLRSRRESPSGAGNE